MSEYLVPTQPRRPPDYQFRTHITRPNSNYDLFHPASIKTQVILYRACRANEMVSGASIDDIHAVLFMDHPEVTKKRLGDVVINSVRYNPRKIKGVTKNNPHKAKVIYVFKDIYDLQYGLEWQICSWLWKLHKPETIEKMERHLRILADSPLVDIQEDYLDRAGFIYKINWPEVWRNQKLSDQSQWIRSDAKEERTLKSLLA